jgi:hypothetical protein
MVESSLASLESEHVMVLYVDIHHLDLHNRQLADKDLKLKFRTNGITHLKPQGQKVAGGPAGQSCIPSMPPLCSSPRIAFNSTGRVVCEGFEDLTFELCQAHRLRSSECLAWCRIPFADVVHSLVQGGLEQRSQTRERLAGSLSRAFAFELSSLTSQGSDLLATLQVSISMRSSDLCSVGGIKALKKISVPSLPSYKGIFDMRGYASDCKDFAQKACLAQSQLQVARNAVLKCLQNASNSPQPRKQSQPEAAGDTSDTASTECESVAAKISEL